MNTVDNTVNNSQDCSTLAGLLPLLKLRQYINYFERLLKSKHIRADAYVGIAYASLHAGPAVQCYTMLYM